MTAIVHATPLTGALTMQQATEQYNLLVEFTKNVLKKDLDFGNVPGVSKPTLLKPGAEKLSTLYRLRPAFELITSREDWDAGFFYYHYRCKLTRDGEFMGEAEGSCNTKEKKYRYRTADRRCPGCGQATIMKSKEEWGGGYYCNQKRGGCGAKFAKGSAEFKAIDAQEVGQIENPEVFDLVNTVQKMAQKRALVAAVLITTGASEFFTQDVEDLSIIDTDFRVVQEAKAAPESQDRRRDVTGEVAQAAGVAPRQALPEASPNEAALQAWASKIGGRCEKARGLGVDVDALLSGLNWRADLADAKTACDKLGDAAREAHAKRQVAPIEQGLAVNIARELQDRYGFKGTKEERAERLAFVGWLLDLPALTSTKDLTQAQGERLKAVLEGADPSELLERWNVSRQAASEQTQDEAGAARRERAGLGNAPVVDAEFTDLGGFPDDDLPF